MADVSVVTLLKRGCRPWFQWMIQEMAANLSLSMDPNSVLPDRPVRFMDGNLVCEPGTTGSTSRLHYALTLHTLCCNEVHVAEAPRARA